MSYLVLARKYRPQTFADIVGQEAVVQTLQNAIAGGKIGQAYLFAGPRGVGKTTAARIFAKAVNCEKGPAAEPDNKCRICQEITDGNALDVLEIDGASNRGIDAIKALRENVKFAPAYARYKIYIIDEVHQLSNDGFNALLKTLEEPPPQVIFIFATTEPQKIPETILSRCQRYNFRLLTVEEIEKQLSAIVKTEKIDISREALLLASQAAEGSMRDGQSILDQILSFVGPNKKIDEAQARAILGITSQEMLMEFSQTIIRHDPLAALALINKAQDAGINLLQLIKDLHQHFRNLLMARISGQPQELISLSAASIKALAAQAGATNEDALLHYLDLITRLENEMRYSDQPRVVLEIGLIKLTRPYIAIEELILRLEALENKAPAAAPKTGQEPAKVTTRKTVPYKDEEPKINLAASPLGKQWGQVQEETRKQKPGLGACLEIARILEMQGNVLTVEFPVSAKFQKSTMERSENIKIAEAVASQVFGTKISLRSVFGTVSGAENAMLQEEGLEIEEAEVEMINSQAMSGASESKKVVENDPIVDKVLSIFDGEIITNKKERKGNA
jgi:DNA polymerase III subunit gamma/tau